MPGGLSFLLKKRFHPVRLDNQEKLFINEQKIKHKADQEALAAQEVTKERELAAYEAMRGGPRIHDPRDAALKFMYAIPQPAVDKMSKKEREKAAPAGSYEAPIDAETGEDEMVKQFKEKIRQATAAKASKYNNSNNNNSNASLCEGDGTAWEGGGEAAATLQYNMQIKQDNDDVLYLKTAKKLDHRTKLERELGLKHRSEPTYEEQVERHPFLQNAPMEGTYAKNMKVRVKPFFEVARNVRCLRCGEWGHRSGDRECALKDYNPRDFERLQREDPMQTYLSADAAAGDGGDTGNTGACSGIGGIERVREMEAAGIRAGSVTIAGAGTTAAGNSGPTDCSYSSRGSSAGGWKEHGKGPETVPVRVAEDRMEQRISAGLTTLAECAAVEGALLATLTRREKMLLLRKLQKLEEEGEKLQDIDQTNGKAVLNKSSLLDPAVRAGEKERGVGKGEKVSGRKRERAADDRVFDCGQDSQRTSESGSDSDTSSSDDVGKRNRDRDRERDRSRSVSDSRSRILLKAGDRLSSKAGERGVERDRENYSRERSREDKRSERRCARGGKEKESGGERYNSREREKTEGRERSRERESKRGRGGDDARIREKGRNSSRDIQRDRDGKTAEKGRIDFLNKGGTAAIDRRRQHHSDKDGERYSRHRLKEERYAGSAEEEDEGESVVCMDLSWDRREREVEMKDKARERERGRRGEC